MFWTAPVFGSLRCSIHYHAGSILPLLFVFDNGMSSTVGVPTQSTCTSLVQKRRSGYYNFPGDFIRKASVYYEGKRVNDSYLMQIPRIKPPPFLHAHFICCLERCSLRTAGSLAHELFRQDTKLFIWISVRKNHGKWYQYPPFPPPVNIYAFVAFLGHSTALTIGNLCVTRSWALDTAEELLSRN